MQRSERNRGRMVPVIATNIHTGEEIRYPSYVEAAGAIGGVPARIANACLNDRPYMGYTFQREDNWVLERGARR